MWSPREAARIVSVDRGIKSCGGRSVVLLPLYRVLAATCAAALLAAAAAAAILVQPAAAGNLPPPSYQIVDLGTLGGYSAAFGLNDCLQVVGKSWVGPGEIHAFLFSGGSMKDLGTIGEDDKSVAYDVNDSGQVVGASIGSVSPFHAAFLYSAGSIVDLSPLGSHAAAALAINNASRVTVVALETAIVSHGYVFDGSNAHNPLHEIEAKSPWPADVDAAGDVVGSALNGEGVGQTFVDAGGVMSFVDPQKENRYAQGVSPSGEWIVGDANGETVGYIGPVGPWRYRVPAKQEIRLTDSPGEALAVNDAGWAVGHEGLPARAFVYDGVLRDLNGLIPAHSGWLLFEAHDIDNRGEIVGTGYHNGEMRAFLLTRNLIELVGPPRGVRLGRPMPIRFLAAGTRPVAPGGAIARAFIERLTPQGRFGVEAPARSAARSRGTAFTRSGSTYTFLLDTRGLTPGRYELRIDYGAGRVEADFPIVVRNKVVRLIARTAPARAAPSCKQAPAPIPPFPPPSTKTTAAKVPEALLRGTAETAAPWRGDTGACRPVAFPANCDRASRGVRTASRRRRGWELVPRACAGRRLWTPGADANKTTALSIDPECELIVNAMTPRMPGGHAESDPIAYDSAKLPGNDVGDELGVARTQRAPARQSKCHKPCRRELRFELLAVCLTRG